MLDTSLGVHAGLAGFRRRGLCRRTSRTCRILGGASAQTLGLAPGEASARTLGLVPGGGSARTRGWYQEGPLARTLGLVLGGGPGIFPPEPLGQKEEVLRSLGREVR